MVTKHQKQPNIHMKFTEEQSKAIIEVMNEVKTLIEIADKTENEEVRALSYFVTINVAFNHMLRIASNIPYSDFPSGTSTF